MEMSNQEKRLQLLDSVAGCLFGGAYGDALGYPVEFMKYQKILDVYGNDGVFELQQKNGKAQLSDDTQMTLFTANALLWAQTRARLRGISGSIAESVFGAYREWYQTQVNPLTEIKGAQISWIYNAPVLHASRAPGITCMSAIADSNGQGSTQNPINSSKGCGGVMRVAPVGCFSASGHISGTDAMRESAEIAALTHGHPLGYIPAAYLGLLVHNIITNKFSDNPQTLEELCISTLCTVREEYSPKNHYREFEKIIKQAIHLSKQEHRDIEAIRELGEGWVAEEALAIGLYCALKYSTNFKKCVATAINHDGDSDSTGSVAGNILGAFMGISRFNIDSSFTKDIEANEIIFELSRDLVDGCKMSEYGRGYDAHWMAKYVYCSYMK